MKRQPRGSNPGRISGLLFALLVGCCALLTVHSALAQDNKEAQAGAEPALDPRAMEGEGSSAAKAFASGDYAQAARNYEVLLKTQGASTDLLFNLGTSWAHAGDSGRAIWALERARLRAPDDVEILQNLEIMRQRVRVERARKWSGSRMTQGVPEEVFWQRLATSWSVGELAWTLVLLNGLFFALWAARRTRKEGGIKDGLTVGTGITLVLLVLVLSSLIARQTIVHTIELGIALETNKGLLDTPVATAKARRHPDFYSGAVVRILAERTDGWIQLRLVDGSQGWVARESVGRIAP